MAKRKRTVDELFDSDSSDQLIRPSRRINYDDDEDGSDAGDIDGVVTSTKNGVESNEIVDDENDGSFPVTLKIGREAAESLENGYQMTSRKSVIINGYKHDPDDEDPSNDPNDDNDNNDNNDDNDHDDDDDDDDDLPGPRRTRRTRSSRSRIAKGSDSEEYQEDQDESSTEGDAESEEYEKLSDDGFVVESEDELRKKRNRRKRMQARSLSRRKRQPSRRKAADSSEEYEDDDSANSEDEEDEKAALREELRELRGATPPEDRRKHLRARKEVNYQILPPAVEEPAEAPSAPVPARRGRSSAAGPLRRLFPTVGPFGGNDVVSVFGLNNSLVPGGNNPNANSGIPIDSDSSDDEAGKSKIIEPAGVSKNKKSSLADSDPLAPDMNIDFDAVGGLDHYINQLKEMVSLPMRYPEIYKQFNVTPPRGVLFHGPPGTGKTLMARALAASCSSGGKKITFFMRKGADCLSKWVGEAERQLRLLFEEAKNQQPSIIFFDEIDGLAPVRSSKQEQIHASIVSTLLALMDGMDNRGQVIVIGATNRPDSVDPALRRPGRFDREFYFPLPDLEARKKIISIHTRKWDPPLNENFIDKIARLTKGYGGADLRAMCTESALSAIQRRYPQIYMSDKKLLLDPSSIHVTASDFMRSIEKIVPSSARSTSSGAEPLPAGVEPLLIDSFKRIIEKLDHLFPRPKKLTALQEAMHVSIDDEDGGFARHEAYKGFQTARIFRPRLLIHGRNGMGQNYIGSAILHHLEGVHVQILDIANLLSDSARTPEAAIVQFLVEAKKHVPSVVFIPNVDIWFEVMSETCKSTLMSMLRSIAPSEKVLLLGVTDCEYTEVSPIVKSIFGYSGENHQGICAPSPDNLKSYFEQLISYIRSKPSDYLAPEQRPRRTLEKLAIAPTAPEKVPTPVEVKDQELNDKKLKNLLKLKLAPLMDLFKTRYKRFKKPPVDDQYLVHLFEPPSEDPNVQHAYVKSDDGMILEVATGKKYYNIDLDIIEERLWNGYYSEPKQYLRDIEMIHLDSLTYADRERTLKSSEMFAQAQVAIEEIGDAQFLQQCKELRKREVAKLKKLQEESADKARTLSVASGNQLQQQEQMVQPEQEGAPQLDELKKTDENQVSSGNGHLTEAEKLANGHIDPPLPTVELVEDVPMQNDVTTAEAEGTVKAKEAEPEPEPEYFVPPPPSPRPEQPPGEYALDDNKLSDFHTQLVNETRSLTVEQLEQVNAALVDKTWNYRHLWNRNELIDLLNQELRQILQMITSIME
uniref:ARAD1C39556p n=1 Tax=Blastobotrys adeninivorans TaxID=409370 RepID=A0A060T3C8_BLAAD